MASTTAAPGKLDIGQAVTVVGFDAAFVRQGAPTLSPWEPWYRSAAGTYRAVAANPNLILVGADLTTDQESGLASRPPWPGEQLGLRDPASGAVRRMTVAGVVVQARWAEADHVFVSRTLTGSMFGLSSENLLWVTTTPATNNDVLAAVINGTHVADGATASSFDALAEQQVGWQRTFLRLASWYVGFALIAAIAGLAAITARSIEERRSDIGVIRSYGGGQAVIRRTFLIEAVAIAFSGTVIGSASALLLAWQLARLGALGIDVAFAPPWGTLAVILAVLVIGSTAATMPSVRKAGAMSPSSALAADT